MSNLTSSAGFKLYMYFATNKNNYNMNLSSNDFCQKANCGIQAYRTAFEELTKKGYLILKQNTKTVYHFYDKAREEDFDVMKEIEEEQERKANSIRRVIKVEILEDNEILKD